MHYVRIRQGSASGKLVAEKSFSSRKAAEAAGHKIAEQYQVPRGCVVCVESPTRAKIKVGATVTAGRTEEDRDTGTVQGVDGDRALVAWDGAQVKTWTPIADLTPKRQRRANKASKKGLRVGSLVTMGSKAPYALRGTVGIVRERTATGWQVDIGGQLYELPAAAMRKANGGRFFVEESGDIDSPGKVTYFVMDRQLDDAVVYTDTYDEAQEIASLLRIYHSPRVSHDAWDEARSRLADYGVSPGARSNGSKHQHPRMVGKDGKTWVTRSVSRGRRIPGYNDVDPYTLPFLQRESTRHHMKRLHPWMASDELDSALHSAKVRTGTRSNPHIPTGAKIIEGGGVLAAPGPKGGWITVGRYQTAVPIRPGGKPAGPGQKTVQFAVLVQDAGASGKGDELCTTAKQAMEVFTILVGKPAVYKAIQDYQIRQGQRVGVQVRPRPNGGAHPWGSNEEYAAWERKHAADQSARASTAAGKLAVMYGGDPTERGELSHGAESGHTPDKRALGQRVRFGAAQWRVADLPQSLYREAPTQHGLEAIAAYILAHRIPPTSRSNGDGLGEALQRRGARVCTWCGQKCPKKPYTNRRGEVFCSPAHRTAGNEAYRRLFEAPAERSNPSWPSATEVQTLIFAPGTTAKAAKAWAKAHGFKAGKTDTSGTGSVRVRQHPPTDYMPDRFRTIPLTDGVQAVVGVPKRSTGRQHLK